MTRFFLPIIGFSLFASCLVAQTAVPEKPAAQNSSTTISTTTNEVVLDMVFRDKKGKIIKDIRPDEIHITEDGKDVPLTSFRMVEGKSAMALNSNGTPSNAGALPLDPMREIRLITLVFEGLDNDGKRFFRQAVKDLLDMSPEQNLYFSVATIDQKLNLLQPFTNNHEELLKTLDRAATWSYIQYSNQSAEVKTQLQQTVNNGPQNIQAVSGGSAPNQSALQSAVQGNVSYAMAKMQFDMLQSADTADREYNARADVEALQSLVQAQAQLPGRKIVIYFYPWLNIPEIVKEQYQNMISTANRANISFYTVDAKGLVTWSQNNSGRDMLSGAAADVREAQQKGNVGEVTWGQSHAAENAENALRSNPMEWLRDLANQTGGAAIVETNDWKAPLRTALDEVRSYYEATYKPTIAVYDGSFRKISVKVDRPNVVVHTRSGYFALPPVKSGAQQMFAYEMPLLKALNMEQPPSDVNFQIAAERFNERGPKVEYMVTIEAPLSGLTFTPQPENKAPNGQLQPKMSSVDAAILAVLKDPQGEIVDKFSKDFAVKVPSERLEAARAAGNLGNMVQSFPTQLAPGTYTLEAVVMDRNGNKVGVKKSSVTVPQPSDSIAISNVVLVRNTEQVKDSQPANPFYFPGGKIIPNLSDTLKGGPGNVLPLYFSVYPDKKSTPPTKFTMAFYKEGQYLGSADAPLPAPQQDGRIPYVANLPADKFTPGQYEIRVAVEQGGAKAEEKVDFQVN